VKEVLPRTDSTRLACCTHISEPQTPDDYFPTR
jgi:hypothetical protein